MLSVLCPFLSTMFSVCRSQAALQVEIVSLRHQIGVLRRLTVADRVAGEFLIAPLAKAFWRNGGASLIGPVAAIHLDRDARWRPGQPSLALHRSCRGDQEPCGWDRPCSGRRTEVRNR